MARARVRKLQDKVPFLTNDRIEEEAMLLLAEYCDATGWHISVPVPVEEIVELHLKLKFEFQDLQKSLNIPDVLGAIWFESKKIRVDVRLEPSVAPHLFGRFRFTLAHEIGHWRLHRKYYTEVPGQNSLFDSCGQPAFVTRSRHFERAEKQANFFGACLLMPRDVVRREWQDWRGNFDLVNLQELPPVIRSRDAKDNANAALEQFCRPFAERFQVSAEAMHYRLEELGFLHHGEQNTLF